MVRLNKLHLSLEEVGQFRHLLCFAILNHDHPGLRIFLRLFTTPSKESKSFSTHSAKMSKQNALTIEPGQH